jgi:hypothetical protein
MARPLLLLFKNGKNVGNRNHFACRVLNCVRPWSVIFHCLPNFMALELFREEDF